MTTTRGAIRIKRPEHIGDAIAFVRQTAGLSQRQLAAKAGFAQAQIGAWEVGMLRPNLGSVTRVFEALGYQLALVPEEDS